MRIAGSGPVLLFALLPIAVAQTKNSRDNHVLADFSNAVESLAQKASPAVVQLTVQARGPVGDSDNSRPGIVASQQATGSGVIIDPDGYVITNAHVIEGALKIDVSVHTNDENAPDEHRHFAAKIVGTDHETDLALLKIDASKLPTLAFLNSNTLRQGQLVVALGSPLGLENSLTVGFISAPVRHLRAGSPMFYIQTDAPINPGNSGGPLLDIEGRIAGINTLIFSQSGGSEGVGFAIPANMVQEVVEHLRAEGRVRRGVIGVIPDDITPVLATALDIPIIPAPFCPTSLRAAPPKRPVSGAATSFWAPMASPFEEHAN